MASISPPYIWWGYSESQVSPHMSNTIPEKDENILTFKNDYKTLKQQIIDLNQEMAKLTENFE